jgi:hypothetical protein
VSAAQWIEIGLACVGGVFAACSGVFAFFMKREMERFDEDRAIVRRLDKESVSWEKLTEILRDLKAERTEDRQERARMHAQNREDSNEFKGLVRDSLGRLEQKIDANDECTKQLANQVHGINLKFEVAIKSQSGYTPPPPPGFNHRR